MKIEIFLSGADRPRPALRKRLVAAARLTLKRERKNPKGDLNLIFTDRKTIVKLNREFLDEKGDTDVIAFPYEAAPDSPFGDVYIAVPVARENARRFGDAADRELLRLVVHGTLHLLGYDDHSKKDHAEMWARQEQIVAAIQ